MEDAAGGSTVPWKEVNRKVMKLMEKEGTDPEVDEIRANSRKL